MKGECRKLNENSIKAPSTNRGAVNTIIVDWIQFTIFYEDLKILEKSEFISLKDFAINLFIKLFKINPCELCFEIGGINGYDFSISYKNIYAYYSISRPDMGINFKLSGQGCRDFESLGIEWIDFFKRVNKYTVGYNRIDIAIDDYTGKYFDIRKLQNYIKKGQVVSKFKFSLELTKRKLLDGSINGDTLQFGSKASRVQITFYNKLLERQSQGYVIDNNIKFWVRTELRFRQERAKEIVSLIIQDNKFSSTIKGILKNYISFIEHSEDDSNKSRWPIADFWQDFTDNIEKIQLSSINIENSISKKKDWLLHSISKSQLMVLLSEVDNIEVDNYTSDYLLRMLRFPTDKISDKDIQLINDSRYKQHKEPITREQILDYLNDIKQVVFLAEELPF